MGLDAARAGDDLPSASLATPGAALSLTGVTYRADDNDEGTSGVSLHIPASQTVALFSRPPAAAAELLDVIGGLRRPRSGQVLVDDLPVDRLRGAPLDRYRRSRGLVSARFPLLPSLSVTNNVLAAAPSRLVDARIRERAARLLEVTGTGHLKARLAGPLPADQQWRILIARALLPSPGLVLAEDPDFWLDSRSATVILDLLMDMQAQFRFTLLLAVGGLATASRCDRLVRLADGEVAEDTVTPGDDDWTRRRIDRIG